MLSTNDFCSTAIPDFCRWLPALGRVLELFEALKSYFNSQEHCPTIIRQCFENPTQELYLWFVYGQLKYFNETILKLERQKTSAVDVAIILTELNLNLHEKRVNNFVPHQAKCILEKLQKDGEVNANFFLNQTICFYEKYKWTQLLQAFKDKDIPISNFQKLVEFVFCLPGTSAPVERIFSIIKNMWSDDRSSMHEKNVRALLVCKSNIDLACTEFYENIKSNVVLLKKVIGTDKYQ